jgi:hypothetical protein
MTPEKRKELLHYAAENPDARFLTKNFNGCDQCEGNIEAVLARPHYDWEIVKEPVVTVEYYSRDGINLVPTVWMDNWDLRITTTDGVRVAELRENI